MCFICNVVAETNKTWNIIQFITLKNITISVTLGVLQGSNISPLLLINYNILKLTHKYVILDISTNCNC